MLLHKKSGALFEDTLIGDYYTLKGINVQGTFRLSTDFVDDFEFLSEKQLPEVSKAMNKVEWNRALILYIGKDRQNQKRRKAELKQARLDRSQFRNITENVIIKGDIIRGLSLDYNVERIEKFDYERILPADLSLNKTPKAMEERFSPAQYGRVLSYGVIINTDYLYYQFENGVRVDLKKSRPESEEQFSLIQDKKGQNDKSIKSKDKKALSGSSGTKKQASGSKVFDMKYLEKELNLPPTKIRTLLRKHYEKPDGGWKWDSQEEINKVIAKIKK
jgi:hypothetical protein